MSRAYKPTLRMLSGIKTWIDDTASQMSGDTVSEYGSTIAPSQSCSESGYSGASSRGQNGTPKAGRGESEEKIRAREEKAKAREDIPWEDLSFGKVIKPMRKYAHTINDIYLLNAFLELCKVPEVDEGSVKLVLLAIRFLRGCEYSAIDIRSIMAHASAYFADVFTHCGDVMCPAEVGNVLVTTMFLGHSYIQDETCPLSVWHRHLFKGYCSLKTISDAVLQVMVIRRYVLRLSDEELSERSSALLPGKGSPRLLQHMEPFVC